MRDTVERPVKHSQGTSVGLSIDDLRFGLSRPLVAEVATGLFFAVVKIANNSLTEIDSRDTLTEGQYLRTDW
jgi:hypothetical protein